MDGARILDGTEDRYELIFHRDHDDIAATQLEIGECAAGEQLLDVDDGKLLRAAIDVCLVGQGSGVGGPSVCTDASVREHFEERRCAVEALQAGIFHIAEQKDVIRGVVHDADGDVGILVEGTHRILHGGGCLFAGEAGEVDGADGGNGDAAIGAEDVAAGELGAARDIDVDLVAVVDGVFLGGAGLEAGDDGVVQRIGDSRFGG